MVDVGHKVGEEDVDIGEEIPVGIFPPVEIEKDVNTCASGKSSSSRSSSSGGDSSSSSGTHFHPFTIICLYVCGGNLGFFMFQLMNGMGILCLQVQVQFQGVPLGAIQMQTLCSHHMLKQMKSI